MKRSKSLYLFVFIVLCSAHYSCYTLFARKKPIYTKCCNFDPRLNTLSLTCSDEKINQVRVMLESDEPDQPGTLFYEQTFTPSENMIILPRPDDKIIQSKTMIIYVWYENHVIHDYRIYVNPADWTGEKLLYGRYSYR